MSAQRRGADDPDERGQRRHAGGLMRTLLWVLLAAALLIVGIAQWRGRASERAGYPELRGELSVAGLGAELRIRRDRWGIPHVDAESETDAYFALGFVHAQDRPVQLLWWREAAWGRLSEWAGKERLPEDRLARWLSLGERAEAHWGELPTSVRRLLTAYAAGINAGWREQVEKGAKRFPSHLNPPDAWEGTDSLAILSLYGFSLGATLEESLVLSQLLEKFGGLESKVFFPTPTPEEEESLVRRLRRAPKPGASSFEIGSLRSALGMRGPSVGSSAIVVGGRHSGSRGPLIAGDAHFEATQPAAVYSAHLRAPGLAVAGMTLPGLPCFLSGWNRDIAWAATYPGIILTDLYVETVHPDRADRYHDGSNWRSISSEEVSISVRDGEAITQRIRRTRHGPLLNDLIDASLEPLAVSWLGAGGSDGLEGMFRLARAGSRAEFDEALALHRQPVLRFSYATREGEFGTRLAGAVPDRPQQSHLLPFPGRTREYDWRGSIAPDALPADRPDQAAGYSVAADGRSPLGGRVEWLWQSGGRRDRLAALVEEAAARGPLSLEDLLSFQMDVVSPRSARIVALVARLVGDPGSLPPETRECLRVLEAWEGAYSGASRGAPLFHRFQNEWLGRLLEPAVGEELLGRYFALRHASPDRLMEALLESAVGDAPALDWLDKQRIEDATAESLRDAWIGLAVELGRGREKWTWNRLTQLYFHSLWPRSALRGVLGPFDYAGGRDTARVAGVSASSLSGFSQVDVVASFRFATDASDTSQAVVALAPGQSEHPGHPHAEDGVTGWLRGDTHLFTTHKLVERAVSRHELRLVPAR